MDTSANTITTMGIISNEVYASEGQPYFCSFHISRYGMHTPIQALRQPRGIAVQKIKNKKRKSNASYI